MSRSISNAFHLVVSTRELQDSGELVAFLSKQSQKYIVSVEYGKNSHPHLDAFFILPKDVRQDKMRDKIIKTLYSHVDTKERINIKLIVNSIDTDERYGFGYSFKENPRQYYSSETKEYLDKCVEYYFRNKDLVKRSIKKFRDEPISIKLIGDMFLQSVIDGVSKRDLDRPASLIHPHVDDYSFRYFIVMSDIDIPADMYQRINIEKMVDWCNLMYARYRRITSEESEVESIDSTN